MRTVPIARVADVLAEWRVGDDSQTERAIYDAGLYANVRPETPVVPSSEVPSPICANATDALFAVPSAQCDAVTESNCKPVPVCGFGLIFVTAS